MLLTLHLLILTALFVLCLGALWFYGYTLYATFDYLSHQDGTIDSDFHPPVTVLKPLCGLDPDLYANLASFCQQDYPKYQIVFAVQSATDPSIEIVHQLIQQFPTQDIQLVISDRVVGINPKVNNLANAAVEAKYGLWVIADSDIRVGRDYLQQVVQPLRYPGVGVVTCPYRSQATGWLATLEALGTATELHPGMLVARKLEGVSFAVGQTIVIRKAVLDKVGGFGVIAAYLADDYQLGNLPTKVGYRVCLSHYIVEHRLGRDSLGSALQRQLRWARGIRVSRPGGYLGKIVTYGTVMSLLLLLVSGGSILGWTMVALTWVARLLMVRVVSIGWLQDCPTQRYWWLLPVYDLLSFGIWCCGLVGDSIEWRGRRFRLLPGGELQATTADSQTYTLPVLEKI